jgi:hypothetical protein
MTGAMRRFGLAVAVLAVVVTCESANADGSSCVSGGYKLEFAAIAFTASTYER